MAAPPATCRTLRPAKAPVKGTARLAPGDQKDVHGADELGERHFEPAAQRSARPSAAATSRAMERRKIRWASSKGRRSFRLARLWSAAATSGVRDSRIVTVRGELSDRSVMRPSSEGANRSPNGPDN